MAVQHYARSKIVKADSYADGATDRDAQIDDGGRRRFKYCS